MDEELDAYPFLKAALEDVVLITEISSNHVGTERHSVILMYDVIEFILYEVLLLRDEDIYANGQRTIGLDSALGQCRKLGIDLPLIGTIRSIQKHRGDAKHHAQSPHEEAFLRLLGEFRVVVSRLVFERFGAALGKCLLDKPILPYHTALYESYRKYRTHNWRNAVRFAMGAVIYKNRTLTSKPVDFSPCDLGDTTNLANLLSAEIKDSEYDTASLKAVERIKSFPNEVEKLLKESRLAEAAEFAGKAYSLLDELFPSIFEISEAKKLTPRLVIPHSFRYGKSMGWSRWQTGDTQEKEQANVRLVSLLSGNSEFVEAMLGTPYYDDDGDRYWKWWELAVFDGDRWHSFHLDHSFYLKLESGAVGENEGAQRERVAKLIYDEFAKAISAFHSNKSKPVVASARN